MILIPEQNLFDVKFIRKYTYDYELNIDEELVKKEVLSYLKEKNTQVTIYVKEMEKDEVVMNAIGEETAEKYIRAKKKEWADYKVTVSDWGIDEYLYKY